jgi:hypothetical protein
MSIIFVGIKEDLLGSTKKMEVRKMSNYTSKTVKVGTHERQVKVEFETPTKLRGYVGKAYFCWETADHELPYVLINKKSVDDKVRGLIKEFIDGFLKVNDPYAKNFEPDDEAAETAMYDNMKGLIDIH